MQKLLNFNTYTSTESIDPKNLPSVCIVTGELVGPFNNGGLGTSMTGLAELLGAYGTNVTILYTGHYDGNIKKWRKRYRQGGMVLEVLSDYEFSTIKGPLEKYAWVNAWNIYQALKNKSFDVIHFNDTMGEGVYCFVAKRCGLAFKNTLLTLALHSPTEWILDSNQRVPDWLGFSCFIAGERISIEATDLLWGPSRYLLSWLSDKQYRLPDKMYQQQYVMPTPKLFESDHDKYKQYQNNTINYEKTIKPLEIVFFGRLEERKGIRIFITAVNMLSEFFKENAIKVLFMGKHSTVGEIDSEDYIKEHTKDWQFIWRIEDDFGQTEAINYLKKDNILAVMASPVDNSPCTIYEALMHGIAFIAAKTGGIPELIDERDHDTHLFDYNATALAGMLKETVSNGLRLAKPSLSIYDNHLKWLGFHVDWKNFLPTESLDTKNCYWAVYIEHQSDRIALNRTITSINACIKSSIVSTIIHVRGFADIDGVDLCNTTLLDESTNINTKDILHKAITDGANRLICLRSGVTINKDKFKSIGSVLSKDVDAIIPAVLIEDINSIMPIPTGNAAFSFLEREYDTGGFFMALERDYINDIAGKVDQKRIYLGLIDELYIEDAKIWPYPEPVFSVKNKDDVIIKDYALAKSYKRLLEMTKIDIYQALSIGRRSYRNSNSLNIFSKNRVVMSVKAYILSKPKLRKRVTKAIRAVFGNRFSRKIIGALHALSKV